MFLKVILTILAILAVAFILMVILALAKKGGDGEVEKRKENRWTLPERC